jgi:hypothetical protein
MRNPENELARLLERTGGAAKAVSPAIQPIVFTAINPMVLETEKSVNKDAG